MRRYNIILGLIFLALLAYITVNDIDAVDPCVYGGYPVYEEVTPSEQVKPQDAPLGASWQEGPDAAQDLPEPNEEELINEALEGQGYLRGDVPLSYTLQDILHTECEINGVPYELALGVIDVESGFDPYADSGPCLGLMQLHKKYYPGKAEPIENIRTGVALLGEKYRQTGNWGAALCSYNKGHDDGSRAYANRVFERARQWGWPG